MSTRSLKDGGFKTTKTPMKKIFLIFALTGLIPSAFADNKEAVRLKIQEHLPDLQKCYDDDSQPDSKGQWILDFEINDKGRVQKAAITKEGSEIKNPKMSQCITQKIKTWSFVPAPQGQNLHIVFPIVFQNRAFKSRLK